MTKIGVIGVGAIGGSLAGFMTLNGEDVTCIDPWRENVEAMRENGLLLDGSTGEHRAKVKALHTDELDQLDDRFDILVVAVKSYDTQWATRLMLPYIHEDTWVVSPQNGINELQIAPIVGARRTVGCVTTISAGMMEPGRVTRTDSTGASQQAKQVCFKVGELDGRATPRVQELARIFEAAGHTVVTDDLWGERWTKVAVNCMVNPTSAMTGLSGYDLRANKPVRKLIFKLGVEAVRVGQTLGFHARVPIGSFTLDDLEQAAIAERDTELDKQYIGSRQNIPGKPSMAQDIIKGRKTEIDYLNGFVAEHGKRIGMPTPYSEAVVPVIKGIESGEFKVGLDNVERVEAIARSRGG
jgi:2-dehydropantoate 2-reductase